jgi:hypothetical protein
MSIFQIAKASMIQFQDSAEVQVEFYTDSKGNKIAREYRWVVFRCSHCFLAFTANMVKDRRTVDCKHCKHPLVLDIKAGLQPACGDAIVYRRNPDKGPAL